MNFFGTQQSKSLAENISSFVLFSLENRSEDKKQTKKELGEKFPF